MSPDFSTSGIIAQLRRCGLWEQQFGGHTLIAVLKLCECLSKQPIPKAITPDSLTSHHYSRLFKILFAYFWTVLVIDLRQTKSDMRRLLTRITDENQGDTDRLCDNIEFASSPDDEEDVRAALGKRAWKQIQSEMPTDGSLEPLALMAFPIIYDSFLESVAELLSDTSHLRPQRESAVSSSTSATKNPSKMIVLGLSACVATVLALATLSGNQLTTMMLVIIAATILCYHAKK